jgi:hypothetical protein
MRRRGKTGHTADKHQITSTKVQTKDKNQITSTKVQTKDKNQITSTKVQTRTKKINSKSQTRRRIQARRLTSNGLCPPRLELAVLPFGPCLLFGACYLELLRALDLGACNLELF